MQKIYNWLLILTYPLRTLFKTKFSGKVTFSSESFDILDTYDFKELEWGGLKGWNYNLPWFPKTQNDWNTCGIFTQKYGIFQFKAKLWQPIDKKSWPALWLLNIKTGVFYIEADIELMCPKNRTGIYFSTYVWYSKFKITNEIAFRQGLDAYCRYNEKNEIVFNPYDPGMEGYTNWKYGMDFNDISKRETIKFQVKTKNRFLIRELQTTENTYTIMWNSKYVKWYLNGVLIAYTTNVPHDEMFIIVSKIDKCSVKVLE